jgi:hypothetical protein
MTRHQVDEEEAAETFEKFRRRRGESEWKDNDGRKPKERRNRTMAAAFQKAGINPQTFSNNHHEPSPTLKNLQIILSKLEREIGEIKGLALEEGLTKLQEKLPQWVEWYRVADKELSKLQESLGKEWRQSVFREVGFTAQRIVHLIKESNPELSKELKRREAEEKAKARQEAAEARAQFLREETDQIRKKATITLHEACESKEGFVVLRVEYFNRNIGREIYGWVLLECKEGKGRIAEATTPVKWLEKYGYEEDNTPRWVPLTPPEFEGVPEKVQFPRTLRIWVKNLWNREETHPATEVTTEES